MDVPHLNFSIEEDSFTEGANRVLSHFRPDWNLTLTKSRVFTDGITNKLVGFTNPQDESDIVLIRINGNKTDLIIDRKKEAETIKRLHAARLAPTLYGTFDNGLVYEYVAGVVLTPETCRLDNVSALVAKKLADMHSSKVEDVASAPKSTLWMVIDKFLGQLPQTLSDPEKLRRFNKLFPTRLDFAKERTFLEEQLQSLNDPVVLCHNDLLLRNIIYNSAEESVTFIDFEYADYNYQSYDIANHFNEFAGNDSVDYNLYPSEAFQRRWLRIYLERFLANAGKQEGNQVNVPRVTDEEIEDLRSKVEKFTLASHFLWGVWSLLQAEYSFIDFDFVLYAFIRFNEYFKIKKKLYHL